MKKKIRIPQDENEEMDFWDTIDIGEYVDENSIQRGVKFPNLELSTERISLRLSRSMLSDVKKTAKKFHIPYQRLIKEYIQRGLNNS